MRISSLWRYPVKSMAGEELQTVDVIDRGFCGDRAYALVDGSQGAVGSAKNAKRFGDLLKCTAQFTRPPAVSEPAPPVVITLPNGNTFSSDLPDLDSRLRDAFGKDVSLVSTAPAGLKLIIEAGTLGGKHADVTELPVSSGAPPGTLFNYASVHLVTTSTLRSLREGHDGADVSLTRFRPNAVIDSGVEEGFIENLWVGRTLAIGSDLRLRVSIPCPRCVVTTLPRRDLPLDSGMLPTIGRLNRVDLGEFGQLPCVGVYADVVQPGRIEVNDIVRFVE